MKEKIILALLISILFFHYKLFSQEMTENNFSNKKLKFGIISNLSIVNTKLGEYERDGHEANIPELKGDIGISLQYALFENFYVRSEILFSAKRVGRRIDDQPSYYQMIDFDINCLDIPIFADYNLKGLHILFGIQPSILLTAKGEYELTNQNDGVGVFSRGAEEIPEAKDYLNPFLLFFSGGFLYEFNNGINLGFRTTYALKNSIIMDYKSFDSTIKNQIYSFAISFGYIIKNK